MAKRTILKEAPKPAEFGDILALNLNGRRFGRWSAKTAEVGTRCCTCKKPIHAGTMISAYESPAGVYWTCGGWGACAG